MAEGTIPISIVILTFNEERNLPGCLQSVASWAGEIFVVDSGSTDRTVDIAATYNTAVVTHPFETHAKQWNWALRHLPFTFPWALCLDADHRVTIELAEELKSMFGANGGRSVVDQVDGFYVKRRQVFRGKWIKHGGYYPKYMLKLLRHEKASSDEAELLDFRFYVDGLTEKLRNDFIEDNQNEQEISFWTTKHVRFANLQAREEQARQRGSLIWRTSPSLFGSPDQRILWLKTVWYRLPLYIRPFAYFAYRYFARLGFLDGKQGFIFHFLQAFWYRLLVDINLDELRRGAPNEPAASAGLSREPNEGHAESVRSQEWDSNGLRPYVQASTGSEHTAPAETVSATNV
jgi:glycosyltransferase involved in cell wall biosynthesis